DPQPRGPPRARPAAGRAARGVSRRRGAVSALRARSCARGGPRRPARRGVLRLLRAARPSRVRRGPGRRLRRGRSARRRGRAAASPRAHGERRAPGRGGGLHGTPVLGRRRRRTPGAGL
ncbi:MAG: hypothetical protein AVDCRST_MAG45-709, partial [uncultured Solirubrobacterales bacterium]